MKYKVLMCGNIFVNYSMLSKGIYEANKPMICDADDTMEELVNRSIKAISFLDSSMSQLVFLNNLRKCKLVTVTLTIDE